MSNVRTEAKKLAKDIKHELSPEILAHNIANNPSDFSEAQILALFVTYGKQRVENNTYHTF